MRQVLSIHRRFFHTLIVARVLLLLLVARVTLPLSAESLLSAAVVVVQLVVELLIRVAIQGRPSELLHGVEAEALVLSLLVLVTVEFQKGVRFSQALLGVLGDEDGLRSLLVGAFEKGSLFHLV